MFMITAGNMMEILKDVPPDTPIILHIEVKDMAYNSRTAKYITHQKQGPYDGGCAIKNAIARNGGAIVISDWKF